MSEWCSVSSVAIALCVKCTDGNYEKIKCSDDDLVVSMCYLDNNLLGSK
jgi:hypothetical protein